MGTVVFTSPRTLRVLGLQKLPFPFIFRGNVPLLLTKSALSCWMYLTVQITLSPTPSHPWIPPEWPYSQQAQCGHWFSVKHSKAGLQTSSHPQNSACPWKFHNVAYTNADSSFLFVCNGITAGTRQGSFAKPLSLLFLTPRPALSFHQHRTLVCLFWSGKLHWALSPENPTTACQECFELLDVSNSSNCYFSNI